jgi:hypothetical protein
MKLTILKSLDIWLSYLEKQETQSHTAGVTGGIATDWLASPLKQLPEGTQVREVREIWCWEEMEAILIPTRLPQPIHVHGEGGVEDEDFLK